MNARWAALISRLDRLNNESAFVRIHGFVNQNNLGTNIPKPIINPVREVLSLWQARFENTTHTGMTIPGITTLIENLKQLPPQAKVEQFGFTGEELAGSIFFDHETKAFLGDTIVERRPKSQKMLDLEAQLFGPTRKSA